MVRYVAFVSLVLLVLSQSVGCSSLGGKRKVASVVGATVGAYVGGGVGLARSDDHERERGAALGVFFGAMVGSAMGQSFVDRGAPTPQIPLPPPPAEPESPVVPASQDALESEDANQEVIARLDSRADRPDDPREGGVRGGDRSVRSSGDSARGRDLAASGDDSPTGDSTVRLNDEDQDLALKRSVLRKSLGRKSVEGIPQELDEGVLDRVDVLLRRVHFEFDKADIQPAYHGVLNEVADLLLDEPKLRLAIIGHADSVSTEIYNQQLSERRAEAVKRELVARGVDSQRLIAVGRGESMPIAPNSKPDGSDNPEGRALNRRAEFDPNTVTVELRASLD